MCACKGCYRLVASRDHRKDQLQVLEVSWNKEIWKQQKQAIIGSFNGNCAGTDWNNLQNTNANSK